MVADQTLDSHGLTPMKHRLKKGSRSGIWDPENPICVHLWQSFFRSTRRSSMLTASLCPVIRDIFRTRTFSHAKAEK
jgi:hypothetical protein